MEDVQKLMIVKDFIKFVYLELGIKAIPAVVFTEDTNFTKEKRSFGSYDPNQNSVVVYVKSRNLADILRSLAHELVHHLQNEEQRIQPDSGETGSDIENEANAVAGVLLRKYGKINPMIYESQKESLKILKEVIKKSI